jgi:hypothetical protein
MGNAIDFGPLIRVSGTNADPITHRTFAAWVYPNRVDGTRAIIGAHADTGGMLMFISRTGTDGELRLYSNRHNVSPGQWRSATTVINTGEWCHVVVRYDHSHVNNNPFMWINGVLQTVVEVNTPAGTLTSEAGTHIVIGNVKTATIDYTWGFDGKIFDARIYDRPLITADAVELYNGGTPDPSKVTSGLVFQAFAVRTSDAADYIDVELNNTDRVIENMYKAVGHVIGTPTARAAP